MTGQEMNEEERDKFEKIMREVEDVIQPGVAFTKQIIFSTKPLNLKTSSTDKDIMPFSGDKSHVTRQQFTPPDHVAIEISMADAVRLNKAPGVIFSDGSPHISAALIELGIKPEDCKFAGKFGQTADGDGQRSVFFTIEKSKYQEVMREAAYTMLDTQRGASLLGLSMEQHKASLKFPNSRPFQALINAIEQGGFDMGEMKNLITSAAKSDMHEVAAAISKLIAERRGNLGIPQGPRSIGGHTPRSIGDTNPPQE